MSTQVKPKPKPRHNLLLAHPRTASHLLLKLLSLPTQSSLHIPTDPEYKHGYLFMPTLGPRFSNAAKPLETWTPEEKEEKSRPSESLHDLQALVDEAENSGKAIYVKEHACWLVEPVTESQWIHGSPKSKSTSDEQPWTFGEANVDHETLTGLPVPFLSQFRATFLIRHPALMFASNYRVAFRNDGAESVRKDEHGIHRWEMSLRWSRQLYEWFSAHAESDQQPLVLDASDLMLQPELARKYAKLVGLDENEVKFEWNPTSQEELSKLHNVGKIMRVTIDGSSGIVKDKAKVGINLAEEKQAWAEEFGEQDAAKIERWVMDAMEDYEFLLGKRLQL